MFKAVGILFLVLGTILGVIGFLLFCIPQYLDPANVGFIGTVLTFIYHIATNGFISCLVVGGVSFVIGLFVG